jgi:hypothetical protein
MPVFNSATMSKQCDPLATLKEMIEMANYIQVQFADYLVGRTTPARPLPPFSISTLTDLDILAQEASIAFCNKGILIHGVESFPNFSFSHCLLGCCPLFLVSPAKWDK